MTSLARRVGEKSVISLDRCAIESVTKRGPTTSSSQYAQVDLHQTVHTKLHVYHNGSDPVRIWRDRRF